MNKEKIIKILETAMYAWFFWCLFVPVWLLWLLAPPLRKIIAAGVILLIIAYTTRKVEIKMIEENKFNY